MHYLTSSFDPRMTQAIDTFPALSVIRELRSIVDVDAQSISLFRKIHAVQEVFEPGVGAQIIDSKIASQEVGEVRRPFLIRLLQKFEGLVLDS